jgi:hypothetical protein
MAARHEQRQQVLGQLINKNWGAVVVVIVR